MRDQVWFSNDKHHFAELAFAVVSLFFAFYLTVLPVYQSLGGVSPAWLLMVLVYWRQHWSRFANAIVFWLVGVCLDLYSQHSLGISSLAFLGVYGYLLHFQREKTRGAALLRTTALLFFASCIFQVISSVLCAITGAFVLSWSIVILPFSTILLWPFASLILRSMHRYFKGGSS